MYSILWHLPFPHSECSIHHEVLESESELSLHYSTLLHHHDHSLVLTIFLSGIFPGGTVVKNLSVNAGDARDAGSIPGLGRFPRSRKCQPAPVFWPGKFHGKRSPVGYSIWGCKESDKTEHTWHTFLSTLIYYDSLIQPLHSSIFFMLATKCSFLKLNLVT